MFTFPTFFFWAENIQEGKFLKKLYEANFPLQRMTDETLPQINSSQIFFSESSIELWKHCFWIKTLSLPLYMISSTYSDPIE